ncbi:MAG TPA: DUF3093 domain-containing protein [Nocardioides sp.]|uniref:DUF3093 domain-containing protein n=1 Tax=Nocardioides sp. TaxID=35761 RepID=UPI002BD01418|nr:DUF3093 domain-containing protein [Nocardioides sp.]HQR27456.1 DUF3093 domain-containing protein [Nocardioides sp.]
MEFEERLAVPLRWWVQGTLLVASLWLALVVALPSSWAWSVTAAALAGMTVFLRSYGGAVVRVRDGRLQAGRAEIEVALLGEAVALDSAQTRRLAGVDADARAYLLLRPYLARGVRVDLADPADPTPYWLVSTRRPDELVTALRRASATLSVGRVPQEE